jgi:phosphoribosylglycinamide formyltransferase-1
MAEQYTLGILASGRGSNFEAIERKISQGELPEARVGVVLSDKEDAGVLRTADEKDIPAYYLSAEDNDQRNAVIVEIFEDFGVDMGVGAGYLKLVGANVLQACRLGVINIHPAPLPEFGGKGMVAPYVHQAVIDSGAEWSGPTVHLMDEEFDHGRILAHIQVPVLKGDTVEKLAARILPQEHDLYWRVIRQQLQRGPHPEAR